MEKHPEQVEPAALSEVGRHPIQVVSRRTGLSPDVLRAWERRFGLVDPERGPGGRRLYSDAEVERLRLLRLATEGGRSIGQVAHLETAALEGMVDEDRRGGRDGAPPPAAPGPGQRAATARRMLRLAMQAVERYDGTALDAMLWRAVVMLSPAELMDHVITPLLVRVGERWRAGTLRAANEHIATGVVRRVLTRISEAVEQPVAGLRMVVGTPARQRHDLGALLAAATATAEGWAVAYLGADLPAEEIAGAVRHTGAGSLALSIVHPADDPALPDELRRLGALLPARTRILAGGAAAPAYEDALRDIGAQRLDDLPGFRAHLRRIREEVR